MRTSHIAIKRMIADEKNKLTDEQLFASRRYAAYLTDIAEGLTGRYHRTSKVNVYWDASPQADIAHTDNRTISLNAGNSERFSGICLTRILLQRNAYPSDNLQGLSQRQCCYVKSFVFIKNSR